MYFGTADRSNSPDQAEYQQLGKEGLQGLQRVMLITGVLGGCKRVGSHFTNMQAEMIFSLDLEPAFRNIKVG